MRVVCVSDTHNKHDRLVLPDGDVLVHAGDLTMKGTRAEVEAGFAWLDRSPHARVIFVPGNHDFAFEREPEVVAELRARYPRVEILHDSSTRLGDRVVYGSPYQPWFHDWAFNFSPGPGGEREAEERWARIPDETAILITHGPVRGILDLARGNVRAGCPALARRIDALPQLQLFVSGHIHEAYGTETHAGRLYVNASACTLKYAATQPPIVVDLDATGARVVTSD